ncbi:hypothetical protein C8P64_0312 [Christiangramia gaetbulicola]|uniref:Protein kinase domain-containing protein n=1 Tax=Christiangramia gaetbulicola TaxID=703340 RepID=A0A2T6AKI6_9FLAO|nr:fructosamine kinase family protein [Christiangramia gaetbulicola]PTX44335.1 hypothetical protein C8P64_0312 [Christiangramia gaetbulicola]
MSAGRFQSIIENISEDFGINLTEASPLSGGDINEVFLLETATEKFVLKLNNTSRFPGMFDAEKLALEKLIDPGVIDVPKPIKTGTEDQYSYLILEHKEPASKTPDFWEIFGEQLAKLHRETRDTFGLEKDNYIGSLPQYNEKRDSAAEFYIEMRLQPQLEIASDKGFQLNVTDNFFKNCEALIPNEPPALVHGDLWNGNYIVNEKGKPCLIDPAVAFAPREMDLGMMKLFGGFNEKLFSIYDHTFPLEEGWKERIELWQLYYLLVHLNIFGAGYKSQVTNIIRKYS